MIARLGLLIMLCIFLADSSHAACVFKSRAEIEQELRALEKDYQQLNAEAGFLNRHLGCETAIRAETEKKIRSIREKILPTLQNDRIFPLDDQACAIVAKHLDGLKSWIREYRSERNGTNDGDINRVCKTGKLRVEYRNFLSAPDCYKPNVQIETQQMDSMATANEAAKKVVGKTETTKPQPSKIERARSRSQRSSKNVSIEALEKATTLPEAETKPKDTQIAVVQPAKPKASFLDSIGKGIKDVFSAKKDASEAAESEEALVKRGNDILRARKNKDQAALQNFDLGQFIIDAEVTSSGKKISQAEYDLVRKKWKESIQQMRDELAKPENQGLSADGKIKFAVDRILRRELATYCVENALMIDALLSGCTRCTGEAKLISAALSALKLDATNGERGIQVYNDHVAAVVHFKSPKRTWDLRDGTESPETFGDIYDPLVYVHGYIQNLNLRSKGKLAAPSIEAKELLIASVDATSSNTGAKITTPVNDDIFSLPAGSNNYGSGKIAPGRSAVISPYGNPQTPQPQSPPETRTKPEGNLEPGIGGKNFKGRPVSLPGKRGVVMIEVATPAEPGAGHSKFLPAIDGILNKDGSFHSNYVLGESGGSLGDDDIEFGTAEKAQEFIALANSGASQAALSDFLLRQNEAMIDTLTQKPEFEKYLEAIKNPRKYFEKSDEERFKLGEIGNTVGNLYRGHNLTYGAYFARNLENIEPFQARILARNPKLRELKQSQEALVRHLNKEPLPYLELFDQYGPWDKGSAGHLLLALSNLAGDAEDSNPAMRELEKAVGDPTLVGYARSTVGVSKPADQPPTNGNEPPKKPKDVHFGERTASETQSSGNPKLDIGFDLYSRIVENGIQQAYNKSRYSVNKAVDKSDKIAARWDSSFSEEMVRLIRTESSRYSHFAWTVRFSLSNWIPFILKYRSLDEPRDYVGPDGEQIPKDLALLFEAAYENSNKTSNELTKREKEYLAKLKESLKR